VPVDAGDRAAGAAGGARNDPARSDHQGAYLNPFFIAQSMASKDLRIFEAEFGMTPASATRVKVANPKQLDLFGEMFETDGDSESPLVQ
jgi:phage terminase small subunit